MFCKFSSRFFTSGVVGIIAAFATSLASSQTVIVTTPIDYVDFGGSQQVADLPGADGRVSFREALLAADNTPGPQIIHFNIPQSMWNIFSDRATLALEGSFVLYSDDVEIDFTSQTEFTGDTNPDGNEVSIRGAVGNSGGTAAIVIVGNNNVVNGLDRVDNRGHGVWISGDYNRVVGCNIRGPLYSGVRIWGNPDDPAEFNVVGGTLAGEGNTLASGNAGVRIDAPADNNVVVGNLLGGAVAGVQVRGAPCCDIFPHDNRIGGPAPEERNVIGGSGYTGEHGSANGELVAITYAVGTIVEGNYIGTEADGMTADFQIAPVGVEVRGSTDTIVRNNLIAGVNGYGIWLIGENLNSKIFGNLIGTDRTGLNALPNWYGIQVSSFGSTEVPGPNQIGGLAPGEANLIAFNDGDGISIGPVANNTRISGNSIHSNGGLGINLSTWAGNDGVTPNDPGDSDVNGGNRLQNFPELETATNSHSNTIIDGTLNSTPNTDFSIEFFGNAQNDGLDHGEGEIVLGMLLVTTDANGNASYSITVPVAVPGGYFISATATNLFTNDTSEFSRNIIVQSESFAPDSVTVSRGLYIAGNADGLASSDNVDYQLQRLTSDIQARTEFVVMGTSPTEVPDTFEFTLEGSVFARSNVVQTIELFDYDAATWELVSTTDAARTGSPDTVVTATATGDVSRFVEPGTFSIEARIRFMSDNPRQNFASNTDMSVWTIR